MNLGDFHLGDTIKFNFNTNTTAGAPVTLAGTPIVAVYRNENAEVTAGVTLTVDRVTGRHSVSIVTSESNGYAFGDQCDVVVKQGTVSGQSIAGVVLRRFSLDAQRFGCVIAKAVSGDVNYVDVPAGTKVGIGDEACTLPNGATAEGSSQKVKTVTVGGGVGASTRVTMHGNFNGTAPGAGTYVVFIKRDGMQAFIPTESAPGIPSVSSDYEDGVQMVGDGSVGNRRRRTGQDPTAP